MSVSRRCTALLLLAGMAVGTHAVTAPAASAVVDPSKIAVLDSIQKMDPILMANCATGTVTDPVGAVAVPPEVPLVGCLTL
ncbi:hypothetical protein GCM10010398_63030 [Streptomyces fimbriatus]